MIRLKYEYETVWFNWLADRESLLHRLNELGEQGYIIVDSIRNDDRVLFVMQRVNLEDAQKTIDNVINELQRKLDEADEDYQERLGRIRPLTEEELRRLMGNDN